MTLKQIKQDLTNGQGVETGQHRYYFGTSDGTVYIDQGMAGYFPIGFGYTLDRAARQCLENINARKEQRRPRLI